MASTPATLALIDAILKDRPLLDRLQEVMNKATVMAEKITQRLTLSGRKGIFPVLFDLNEGVYILPDNGDFGSPQSARPYLAEVKAKLVYALFDITGPSISFSRDNPGAFQDALTLNLEKTVDGLRVNLATMYLGRSSNVLAVVDSRTDADTLVVKNPFGLTTYIGTVPARNILRRGMPFDVYNSSGSTQKIAEGLVSTLTHSATLTTMDWSGTEIVTPAATDIVVRSKGLNAGMDGFFEAVQTTGTYLNIARAGNIGWQGVVVDATGGGSATVPLDPGVLQDTVDLISDSGKRPNYIVTNYKQRRAIENLYAPQIRFPPMQINAGVEGSGLQGELTFDGIPVIVERFFPPQHIGFINTDTWYHAIDKDVEWITTGLNGGVLYFVQTADRFRAVLNTYRNLVCLYPGANGFVYGLSE
jgi:hypothetical protein